MALQDIKLQVARFNLRAEMLADLYAVLRLLQHAQAAGSNYGAATHEQYRRLQDAKQTACDVLEQIKAENTKYRLENA